MDQFLARLERRFGSAAIPNLIGYIVGGVAIVWLLSLSRPEFASSLALDLGAVRHGQLWRLVTFIFIPPLHVHPFFLLINLSFAWWVGSSLEAHWGAFKFNLYVLSGVVAAIGAAAVSGGWLTANWLDGALASLTLAFATLAPDSELYLYFVPIRAKWMGFLTAAILGFFFVTSDFATRAAIAAVLVVYVLFFGAYWWQTVRQRQTIAKQKARRPNFESRPPPDLGDRACALCGAREGDGADIRVCSCEKCGGKPRQLCLEHARQH